MSADTRRRIAVGIAGLAAIGGIAFSAAPAFADTGAPGPSGTAQPGDPQGKPGCIEIRKNPDGSISVVKCDRPPAGVHRTPATPAR
ncbi:hypothetical protein [Amycolatopsis sp. NBC_01480]|uniref:hypothetical protein n=1 Tax=Amycolatopsis sp. NBC_01480 TaxID=2903562 RepID=UPI002E289851|nr:hypothetical protein [Amycolatopsis sp. NBC_01480]